jgi:hypothetical protein
MSRVSAKNTNPLEDYFRKNDGRLIHKWVHYFEVYHRHFERFRGTKPVVLEFGVSQGGSLQMWRDYFGRGASIHGVDINPKCKELEQKHTKIFIGDQADREFLRSIADEIGPIDVVIEDGGHFFPQQINTFEEIWPRVTQDGVFLIEDLHTSYWPRYGGKLKQPDSFIEYAKDLSDQLNAWHSRQPDFKVDDITRTVKSMHWYDSIIVFEKGEVIKPHAEKTGAATVKDPSWTPEKKGLLRRS